MTQCLSLFPLLSLSLCLLPPPLLFLTDLKPVTHTLAVISCIIWLQRSMLHPPSARGSEYTGAHGAQTWTYITL